MRFHWFYVSLLTIAGVGASGAAEFDVRTFRAWPGYAVSSGSWLAGDLNSDGRGDMVHLVGGADYVHTWTSDGSGGFSVGAFRPWPGYAISNGSWVTGDLDNDRRADMVHLVGGADYVHTWRSRGDGTFNVGAFRPWVGYAISSGSWVTGDLDNDRNTDMVHLVGGADYVHTWRSRGDGTFNVGTFRPWPGYAITNGRWVTGDIDNDRRTDLVHLVGGTDYVHTWRSRGDGTFNVGTFRPWPGYAISSGEWLSGDIDGDSRADLIHIVGGADYVHTWRSRGDGTFDVGTFRPWPNYAMPNGFWRIGDFNGDGRADLFHGVQNADYAHIWLSRGNGTFEVRTFRPWPGYTITGGHWTTLDLTGDGKLDLVHAVPSADYVHPWISTMPAAGQFSLDGIEISQGIQNMTLGVPLIANKSTLVRAYLALNAAAAVTVQGQLTVTKAGSPTTTVNSTGTTVVDPSGNGNLRLKREGTVLGLNFTLPAGYTSGNVRVAVSRITDATGAVRVCSDCSSTTPTATYEPDAALRVRLVGLRYTTGTPPQTFEPGAVDYNLTRSWLRRAYPTGTVNWSQTTVNASNVWPFGCGQANAQVAAIRALDVAGGTDARTHYYGLVHDGGGFMRGCAAGIPQAADPATVASGPTGPGTFGWDTDGTYGDWYTGHELGHTFGRFHPGSGCGESSDDPNFPFPAGQLSAADGAFTGFDQGDAPAGLAASALPGVTWHDVMTYCTSQWLNSYTYGGIRNRLVAENGLPAGPEPSGMISESMPRFSLPVPKAAMAAPPAIVTAMRIPPAAALALAAAPSVPAPALERAPELPSAYRDSMPALAGPERASPPHVSTMSLTFAAAQARAATGPAAAPVTSRPGDFLHIVATLNLTKATGKIEYVNRVSRGMALAINNEQRAQLRLKDAGGRVLAEYAVKAQVNTDLPADQDQTALIDAAVSMVPQASAIELVLSGNVVDTWQSSGRAPAVRALRMPDMKTREALGPGASPLEVSWEGATDDRVTFTVQISSDGGRSWQTESVRLRDTRYRLDAGALKQFRSVLVRVIATDGFTRSVVTSQPLAIPQ